MLAGIAQFERDLLSERVKSGLAAARARGKKLGRTPLSGEQVPALQTPSLHAVRVNIQGEQYSLWRVVVQGGDVTRGRDFGTPPCPRPAPAGEARHRRRGSLNSSLNSEVP